MQRKRAGAAVKGNIVQLCSCLWQILYLDEKSENFCVRVCARARARVPEGELGWRKARREKARHSEGGRWVLERL